MHSAASWSTPDVWGGPFYWRLAPVDATTHPPFRADERAESTIAERCFSRALLAPMSSD